MVKIIPRIELENRGSRALVPLSINGGLCLRNLSYQKLPQLLLKLSVLKLDGSSFGKSQCGVALCYWIFFEVRMGSIMDYDFDCVGVHVARNATVAELKLAIEEVFSWSPKEDQGKISWSHVWGHFCLCYEGQKLVNDKAYIQSFGIKDGDQLKFIRHMSINYRPEKQRSKMQGIASRQCLMLSSGSNDGEEREQARSNVHVSHIEDRNNFKHHNCEEEATIPMPEFKLSHFLKGWLSYSKIWGGTRRTEGRNRLSRFSLHGVTGRQGV
ncbi:unnamed protein product [Ilex paraguariensis]|uniref:SNRNP25 ubiquitin-like domain-containing protein n=1 Tax=Ilex paraguariensis TaxID=185542 RepID=A0ABC8T636_9AQUA